jgi:hypothetical protein
MLSMAFFVLSSCEKRIEKISDKQNEIFIMPGFTKVELLASEEFSGSLDEWMTEGLVKRKSKTDSVL